MKKKPEYPLAQVLMVKQQRVEEAEKLVKQRREELEKEEEKLRKTEEARDEVKTHKADKLQQLRDALDEGTTSTEVEQMKHYLEVVDERLAGEEAKVTEQQTQVSQAEQTLQEAITLLQERRMEVEKLEVHQAEWEKEMKRELRIEEEKDQDELGQTSFLSKRHEQKRRKK